MIEYPTADQLLAGPLGQWLDAQIAVREEAKRKSAHRLWLAAMVLGPAIVLLFILAPMELDDKFWLSFVVTAIAWGWSGGPKRAAVKVVKGGINEALAGALGLKYCQDCEPGTGFATARQFALLPSYDKASFEDSWDGTADGVAFSLHEAHLQEWRQSGKNRRLETVFRGAIITIGFTERFHGTTVLAREGSHDGWFRGPKDTIELGGLTLAYADMVHPDFADVFDVYTTDQTEARWLMHPEYIERLIAVEQAYGGKDLAAVFTGGELVIVLKSSNMFESGSIDHTEDRTKIEECIGQFRALADLALRLNRLRVERRSEPRTA